MNTLYAGFEARFIPEEDDEREAAVEAGPEPVTE
jgi:hypothetical protein